MRILNSKGMGLIEVMAIALVGSAAMFAMMNSMNVTVQTQRKNQVTQTARKLQIKFTNLIQDSNAWEQTVANNNTMLCLKNRTPCNVGTNTFDIYDGTKVGVPKIYYSVANLTADGYGLDENGNRCPGPTDHTGTVGSACPFAILTQWTAWCPGGPSCIDPRIQIQLHLIYNGIGAPPLNTDRYGIGLPPNLYFRNSTALEESFSITQSPPAPFNQGGGICSNTTVTRNLAVQPAAGSEPSSDPYKLLTAAGPAGFTFHYPGTYRCSGSAVGFSIGGFQIRLRKGLQIIATGTGFAPTNIQTSATLEALFDVSDTSALYVFDQQCGAYTGIGPTYALGLPATSYTGGAYFASTFASLVCVKIK